MELKEFFARVEQFKDLNAWAYVEKSPVSESARGVFAGKLVGVKDLFTVKGMPLKAGTKAPLPAFAVEESPLVTALRSAGALIVGKTNMHEIALGATGENMHTGDVKNPYDSARQSGGSSSGSAVAVATKQCDFALGSDTGGSVRIPAAFCGVVGFKPSFNAWSLAGALHLSYTFDHAGLLANSVADCAAVHTLLTGEPTHTTHIDASALKQFSAAIPAQWLQGRLSHQVRERFEAVLSMCKASANIAEVATPVLPLAWTCYTPIARAEGAHVHQAVLGNSKLAEEGFSPSVLAPLRAGEQISAKEYLDARAERRLVRSELDAILAAYDVMLLPTSPVIAPLRGQTEVQVEGGEKTVREMVLGQTLPFSMCGLPAISVPMGKINGMPVGLQIVAARGQDVKLLHIARRLEDILTTLN